MHSRDCCRALSRILYDILENRWRIFLSSKHASKSRMTFPHQGATSNSFYYVAAIASQSVLAHIAGRHLEFCIGLNQEERWTNKQDRKDSITDDVSLNRWRFLLSIRNKKHLFMLYAASPKWTLSVPYSPRNTREVPSRSIHRAPLSGFHTKGLYRVFSN